MMYNEMFEFDAFGRRTFPIGFLLMGRYRVIRRIAETALSIVYLAADFVTDDCVAIKQLAPRSDDEDLDPFTVAERFKREAQLLGSLSHIGLPHYIDSFHYKSEAAIVMEYIDGVAFNKALMAGFSARQALELGLMLCEVVAFLHNQDTPIIHADIKPSNVMIDKTGRLVLIDLGLARAYQSTTAYDEPSGTAHYAPPEQWRGEPLSPCSDVFSLGVTLRELYQGLDCWKALESVIVRATATRPQDRYHSAGALAHALYAVAAEQVTVLP